MTLDFPAPPGHPFRTTDAYRVGLSDRALADDVKRGELVKPCRGWYHSPAPHPTLRAAVATRARIALHDGPTGAVISHRSAAALHGVPLLRTSDRRLHLTVDRSNGGRRSDQVHLHGSPPDSLELTDVDGVPVTGLARTLIDLSRSDGFRAGVCAVDYALRRKLITREDLGAEVDRHAGRKGVAIARDVVEFADPLAESPGESLSRCIMRTLPGIPAPRLQHEHFTHNGRLVARTDFSWGDGALAGKFDGRVKYTRGAAYRDDPSEVVWLEKQREDELRDLGVLVVCWVWALLYRPEEFRRHLLNGLRRADIL